MPQKLINTEYQEAIALADYLLLLMNQGKILNFTHLAQETFTLSWSAKAKNKRQGVRPGVPDYLIVLPYCLLFIELKRTKGGKVSSEQQKWIDDINKSGTPLKRHFAFVVKGFDEAKTIIDSYLLI